MTEPVQVNDEKIASLKSLLTSATDSIVLKDNTLKTASNNTVTVPDVTTALLAMSNFKTMYFTAHSQYLKSIEITVNTFAKFRHLNIIVSFTELGVARRDANVDSGYYHIICNPETLKTKWKHTGVLTALDDDDAVLLIAQTYEYGILLVVPTSVRPITTSDYIGDIFWIDDDDSDEITWPPLD